MKIYKANILHTPTPDRFEAFRSGYVVVDDDGLVVGTYAALPESFDGCEITDFGDRLLIPAMNDLHLHAPQFFNMGKALDLQLLEWLQTYTFPEEGKFADTEYADYAYSQFVHELWRQGTMRSAIFASIHPDTTLLLADKLSASGLGALVGLVGMDRNCPDYLSISTEQAVDYNMQLINHLQPNRLVRPIVTPRFIPSCSDTMLDALGSLAAKYQLPVQSHLSENLSEIAWVAELQPESSSYGDAYYRHGLFGQTPTLMAHCCYTDGAELELMSRQGVYAVHCPTSNSNLASGMAHVRRLLNAGVRVALGSDIAGGHTMSMFQVVQHALQISKLVHSQTEGQEPFLTFSEAFWLATKSGGSFFGRVGSFEPGYEFDALVVDDSHGVPASCQSVIASASTEDTPDLATRLERFVYLGDDRNITHRFCSGREIAEPIF